MPKTLLTDLSVRALKAETRTDFWDTKTPAFGVRVGRNSKTFVVKRGNRRLTIGRFGDWTLQDARQEAKRLLLQKSTGKRLKVGDAIDIFVETHLKAHNRASTQYEHERLLRKHLADLLATRMEDVTKQDILNILRKLQRTPSTANHVFTICRVFFRWAAKNDYIEHSPLASLSLPHKTKKRKRVLTDDELRQVWIAGEQIEGHFGTIVRLLMLTGQRRGEIAALQKSFYSHNQQTLCLPSELTKNGREHCFPVGTLTQEFLTTSTASPPLLFPARGSKTKPFNGWSKSKKALDKICPIAHYTLHDLRRSYRTNIARLGVPPHVAERLINHVSSRSELEEIYDQHKYLSEMRAAIDKYEQWFVECVLQSKALAA